MATIRFLVSSLPTSIQAESLPLHSLIQFQNPKLSCLRHSNSRETHHVSSSSSFPMQWQPNKGRRVFKILAVVEEETSVAENADESEGDNLGLELKKQPRPCELYVCNLPRSCDLQQLVDMFSPHGAVLSVEVSKNPETGVSRGSGYVTMGSINSARNAIAALDGSDVSGREMRVKFSVDMNSGQRNPEALNSAPMKTLFYESPNKLYIGNLAWTVKPDELRDQFSKFGTIVSARMLYDRKGGKNRAYGFMSFTSAAERDAALSLNGTEFHRRVLVVKKGIERES